MLIAGGIGITPILAMARRLEALGRSWELHYGARARSKAAFFAGIEAFAGERLTFYESESAAPRFPDIAGLAARLGQDAHIYCCGPTGLLDVYLHETARLAKEQVHFERFAASAPVDKTGGFTVELARSGGSYFVPDGKTILDVLLDAGFDHDYSCQQGICGTCRTKIIEGEPDHHDEVLTHDEREAGDVLMICCSRAKSERLVLDL